VKQLLDNTNGGGVEVFAVERLHGTMDGGRVEAFDDGRFLPGVIDSPVLTCME